MGSTAPSDEEQVLYDPFDPLVLEDPYPYYQELRDNHPVYYNARRRFWTVSRFDDTQEAARNWKALSSASGVELDDTQTFYPDTFGPGNVVITDPPDHRRIRAVAQQHFTPRAVQRLEPQIRSIVVDLLDGLEQSTDPDLAHDFAWRIPVATVSHMLGFPPADRAFLADLLFEFETREPDADQDDYFDVPAVARRAGTTLAGYIADQLDSRRAHPGDDLLSMLVRAEAQGQLEPDEPRGLTFILVMAGVDTTACLVSNALHRLQPLGEDRRRIPTDREFATRVIEELVRFEAPVQGEARVALEDVTIRGGRSAQDRECGSVTARQTVTSAGSTAPTTSTSTGGPNDISVSERVFTTASAHRWPGWRVGLPSRSSAAAFPNTRSARTGDG